MQIPQPQVKGAASNDRVLVWDLPTRLFHWLLAGGVLAAFGIAQTAGKRDPLFPYHCIVGIVLGALVTLRILWGIVGTRYARFGSFLFGPRAVIEYFRGVWTGQGARHIGHNPGSSYAIFAMLLLVLLIVGSGLLMGLGYKEAEEIHSASAYVLVGVVGVHIAGVIVHTVRHRENITWSMVGGRKRSEPSDGIRSSRPVAGLILLTLAGFLSADLIRNYDAGTRSTRLPVLGTSIRLAANEKERGKALKPPRRDDDD